MMAESFFGSFQVPVITLRPFNTYGLRQSGRAVVSTVIRQALDDRCEVVRLGNLTPARDFTFVADIVAAFIKTAELGDEHLGEKFNAGSGRMATIGEIVELVRRITGRDKPVVQEDHRMRPADSEIMAPVADSARLREASGWTPKVSLEEGLAKTVDWWSGELAGVRAPTDYVM